MSLIKYLPSFYYASTEVKNIQASIEVEAEQLKANITDLLNQLYVTTATWGLDYWETYLGIEIDKTQTNRDRQSRILTRLRGQGTITKDMIKNVCESFIGGEVEIIENSIDYSFNIKFVSVIGIPSNLEYLSASIEEIKPAHLAYTFEFTFNTYDVLAQYSYDYLSQFTYDELREKDLTKGVK
ncbi:MAG: YmfQ family protein [Oscillospiraceae bacterium]